jgi:hypothetical protein
MEFFKAFFPWGRMEFIVELLPIPRCRIIKWFRM